MIPEPTMIVSWDYLVELIDDGTQPHQTEPEVILIPPAPRDNDRPAAAPSTPGEGTGDLIA